MIVPSLQGILRKAMTIDSTYLCDELSYSFQCFFSMIICFLFVGFLAYTSAALISPTLHFASNQAPSNLTSIISPAQSNSPEAPTGGLWSWYKYCTKIRRWSLPQLELDDCSIVLDYFYLETMEEGGGKIKEFLAPGAKKTTYAETEWTPRKYTFGRAYLKTTFLLSNATFRFDPTTDQY